MRYKCLSLFANVGIAEAYLKDIGIDVVLANEIDPKRVKFYKHLYTETEVIEGDITNLEVYNTIVKKAKKYGVDFIIATPPCQGMSNAGKKDANDPRNELVTYAINIIKELNPKYALIENVPQQLTTYIDYKGNKIIIPEYIRYELENGYYINDDKIINAADYGVPQVRERAIFLFTRKDMNYRWEFPSKERIVSLEEAIGDLPVLDPIIYDIPHEERIKILPNYEMRAEQALLISKWHIAPKHVLRQVIAMMHTPTGETAFNNQNLKHKPLTKEGNLVRGFKNTYKRQLWDKPAYTITMYNRTIGSQNNVHPGRYIGEDKEGYPIYSDPRVLTVYELMIVMSLPKDWNIPQWATEAFVRGVIGEGIPPLLIKKLVQQII